MIRVNQNKGFSMTFKNGLTISVQFGTGNYCSRRDFIAAIVSEKDSDICESDDAEIAIWDSNNTWFNFGSDTVKGWVSVDEVGDWINRTMNATSIETL